jgi:hypothetical protein
MKGIAVNGVYRIQAFAELAGVTGETTGGDKGIEQGLGRAWQDRGNWSEAMKTDSEAFADRRVWDFIRKACAARGGA